MATPWDRATEGYVAEWLPRFTPYQVDLVEELALEGTAARVLVPCCGTGAEVIGDLLFKALSSGLEAFRSRHPKGLAPRASGSAAPSAARSASPAPSASAP